MSNIKVVHFNPLYNFHVGVFFMWSMDEEINEIKVGILNWSSHTHMGQFCYQNPKAFVQFGSSIFTLNFKHFKDFVYIIFEHQIDSPMCHLSNASINTSFESFLTTLYLLKVTFMSCFLQVVKPCHLCPTLENQNCNFATSFFYSL